MRKLPLPILTSLILGSSGSVGTPELAVYGGGNTLVPNGDNSPSEGKYTLWLDCAGCSNGFECRNNGTAALTITGIDVPSDWEVVDESFSPFPFPFVIAAGDFSAFFLYFTNHAAGTYGGTVTIHSNIADYSFAIAAENT